MKRNRATPTKASDAPKASESAAAAQSERVTAKEADSATENGAATSASVAAEKSESAADESASAAEKPDKKSGAMGVTEHLRELRNRIVICLAALLLCMGAGLWFADRFVRALLAIGEAYGYRFVYLSPQEMLLQYVSVAFVCAACVTLPVTLYELWAFLRPGLRRNERVFYILTMLSGLVFAALGILFASKALIPFMLRFLMSLNRDSGAAASVSVQNYISFLLTIFVIFAVIFELPVVTVLLTQLGLVKIEWLKRARRVMIVVTFCVAAVITPPDIVSQVMVAVPLLGLYEFSILACGLAARLRKPRPEGE